MSFVSVNRTPRDERPAGKKAAGGKRKSKAAALPARSWELRVEGLEDRSVPTVNLLDVNSSVLGAGNGEAHVIAVTPSGRYAIFESTATNIIPQQNDIPGTPDLFWADLLTGQRKLVTGAPTQLSGTYTYTNTTTTFSRAFPGVESFNQAVISDDGQFVAFTSKVNAGSLDAEYATSAQIPGSTRSSSGDRGDASYDVFRWNARSSEIRLASRTYNNSATAPSEAMGNRADAINPAISGDGSKITYVSNRNAANVYPAPAAGKIGQLRDNGDASPDLFMVDFLQISDANGAAISDQGVQNTACLTIVANPYFAGGFQNFPSFFWKEPFGTFGFVGQFQPLDVIVWGVPSTSVDPNTGVVSIIDWLGTPPSVGYTSVSVKVDTHGRYLSSDGSSATYTSDVSPAWVAGVTFPSVSTVPLTHQRLDVYLDTLANVNSATPNVPDRRSPTRITAIDSSKSPPLNVGSTVAVQGGSADNAILARDTPSVVLFTLAVNDTNTGSILPGYTGPTGSGADAMNLYMRNCPQGSAVGDTPILVNAIAGNPTTPGAQAIGVPGQPASMLALNYSQVVTSGSSAPVDPNSYQITPDARYAVFVSPSSDLVPPGKGVPIDRNNAYDVFRRDLTADPNLTTSMVIVSAAAGGATTGNKASYNPVISPDGRFVGFESLASNLVAAGIDTNNAADIYVRDFQASKDSKGNFIPGTGLASASPDGTAAGNDGPSTFTFNGSTPISTYAGGPPDKGSYLPAIGGSGSTFRVLFTSTAGNLVPVLQPVTGTPHGYSTDLPIAVSTGPSGSTAVGAVSGGSLGQASLIGFTGSGTISINNTFTPFPGWTGEVRVAVADVDGDGVPDLICAAGPGGGPRVVVINGADGTRNLHHTNPTTGVVTVYTIDFMAFEPSFRGGVTVAAGDFNGDGSADIVVGADTGGGSRVRVISGADGKTIMGDFFAYEPDFRGGVRVAVGDVNGDGTPDIITAAGTGGGPRVTVFDGKTLPLPTRFADFFAFEPTLRNGTYVAAGDINGDGTADVVVGGGPGGGPRVIGLDGKSVASGSLAPTQLVNLFAFDSSSRDGVRVAVHDINGDGTGDLLVGQGTGQQSRVRTFLVPNTIAGQTPTLIDDQVLYGDFGSLNGAWVG
jgi:hypothetical protein